MKYAPRAMSYGGTRPAPSSRWLERDASARARLLRRRQVAARRATTARTNAGTRPSPAPIRLLGHGDVVEREQALQARQALGALAAAEEVHRRAMQQMRALRRLGRVRFRLRERLRRLGPTAGERQRLGALFEQVQALRIGLRQQARGVTVERGAALEREVAAGLLPGFDRARRRARGLARGAPVFEQQLRIGVLALRPRRGQAQVIVARRLPARAARSALRGSDRDSTRTCGLRPRARAARRAGDRARGARRRRCSRRAPARRPASAAPRSPAARASAARRRRDRRARLRIASPSETPSCSARAPVSAA